MKAKDLSDEQAQALVKIFNEKKKEFLKDRADFSSKMEEEIFCEEFLKLHNITS